MNDRFGSLVKFVENSCDSYQNFVKRNLDLLGEVEGALKWISYVIAGQSKETSPVFSELVYTLSNVLSFINDSIIRRATFTTDTCSSPPEKIFLGLSEEHIRVALTLIDHLEVFIEISCLRVWGLRGKWLAITAVQLCKTVLRLIYLIKRHVGFLFSPPIPPMTTNQRKLAQQQLIRENIENSQSAEDKLERQSKFNMTFTLKRSGRTIRTMSAASGTVGRSWKIPDDIPQQQQPNVKLPGITAAPTVLDKTKFYAEFIHILRPIAHLLALRLCGQQSWKPWIMALGMDVTSLRLVGNPNVLNYLEKNELRLRSWGLLYYMLRSPFFDKHTKAKITHSLDLLSSTIPGARFLCNPIIDYLPSWQRIYFYTWGN